MWVKTRWEPTLRPNDSPNIEMTQTTSQANKTLRSSDTNAAKDDRLLVAVIRLGAFLCFAGWTWIHFYWEGPYGILLWQDSTYELANRFGISWDEFVGSGANDGWLQKWLARVTWLYLGCAILTLTVGKRSWVQMAALLGGSGMLVVLSYAKYVASQRQLPMLVEQGGQVLIPVTLVFAVALGVRHRVTVVTAIIAVVMTFIGHGCYAVGLWPTPPTFYAMTSVILGVEYETAKLFLSLAGAMDFLVCIGIFVPWVRRGCACYAVLWGTLTAIARPVSGMSWDLNYFGADQFLQEAVVRAPHFLIPLYLFLLWQRPTQVGDRMVRPTSANGHWWSGWGLSMKPAVGTAERNAVPTDSPAP